LASVTTDRVRNRVNLSSSDISDSIVTEFIVDACAEIELETGRTINYQDCENAEASCITDLAALYCHHNSGVKIVAFKLDQLRVD